MVNTLNEYNIELSQLLDLITHNDSKPSSNAKWLMASQNRLDIKERLRPNGFCLKISLELNSFHIFCTINAFIDFKVQELAEQKKYDNKLCKKVRSYLYENAEGTFL